MVLGGSDGRSPSTDGSSCNGDSRAFCTPPASQNGGGLARTSLIQMSAEKRAKKVRFYRNGDRYFCGVLLAVSTDHYRSWDSLLVALNAGALVHGAGGVLLRTGVRTVYTLDGVRVDAVDQLLCGESYVCASGETFKRIDYREAQRPTWLDARRSRPTPPSSAAAAAALANSCSPVHTPPLQNGSSQDVLAASRGSAALSHLLSPAALTRDYIRPKLITVIRSGTQPRRVIRFLLNRRTAHSFEQVLQELSGAVRLDSGAIRRMVALDGSQVRELPDFFADADVFLAYGTDKQRAEDFDLHPEEVKWIAGKSHARREGGSLLAGRRVSSARAAAAGGVVNSGGYSRATPVSSGADSYCYTLATPGARRRRMRKSARQAAGGAVNGDAAAGEEAAGASSDIECPQAVRKHYWVGRKIGDGNFAVVYESVNRSTGNEFAIKVIDKTKCRGKEHMIDNEVSILRRVRHPNIIRLVEEVDCPDQAALCLVLELVKGGDLFDAISLVSRYSEREVSGMIRDLASALSYLHQLSIVHRDIKPENLLLLERPGGVKSIKLADFGLAQRITVSAGPLYAVCGTPTYVAPEILAGTGYGVKVDIWATGVIAYILLCGFPPFVSATNDQEELFDRILAGHFEFLAPYWDDVGPEACQLITAMLQVDPDARFSAEDVLIHPWVADDTVDAELSYLEAANRRRLRWNDMEASASPHLPAPSLSSARSLPCLTLPGEVEVQ